MQDHAWVLENILLFLPFGILLPVCLPGRGHWLTVPAGILCSACIEYIQLRTGRGYCQLDDVVMNGLGALAGWLIWWLIRLFCMGVRLFWHQTFIRKRVFLVAAVLWMVVIFLFSSQPADESTQTSLRVERVICALMIPDYNMKTPEEQTRLNLGARELFEHLKDKIPAYYYENVLISSGKTLSDFLGGAA